MNEINASKRLKEAARERAEGDKILMIKSAVRPSLIETEREKGCLG
jgi:hypothetical protein